MGRASSVVKESFSKIESPKESSEAAQLLKTLLEGVEMTEKQLAEVDCYTPWLCCLFAIVLASIMYFLSVIYKVVLPLVAVFRWVSVYTIDNRWI